LKARADAALATLQRAEERIQTLQAPSSLAGAHSEYIAAIRLFQRSALEIQKMSEDGDDGHLLASYRAGQQASDQIREVGARFWQDE
jgi:hypothetical protein